MATIRQALAYVVDTGHLAGSSGATLLPVAGDLGPTLAINPLPSADDCEITSHLGRPRSAEWGLYADQPAPTSHQASKPQFGRIGNNQEAKQDYQRNAQ